MATRKPARKTAIVGAKKSKAPPVKRSKAITAKSQITKKAPSKRLQKRRAANTVPGYFPNPTRYLVMVDYAYADKSRGDIISTHRTYAAANKKASQSTFWRVVAEDAPPSRKRKHNPSVYPGATHAIYQVGKSKQTLVALCPTAAFAQQITAILNANVKNGYHFIHD